MKLNVIGKCQVLLSAAILALTGDASSVQTLIHHWTFDGNTTDSAGSANGTMVGGTAAYATGRIGQAIRLDGLDDYVSTSAGSIVPATDYTLTAWVFWDDGDERGRIAGGQSSGSQGEVFSLSRNTATQGGTDQKVFLNLLPSGATSVTESPDTTTSTGTWMHVAYSVDSTHGTKVYFNGAPVATNPSRTTHTPASNFVIGRRADAPDDHFDGLIDDVALFAGVLDDAQITNVMNLGAQNFESGPTKPSIVSYGPTPGDGGVYPGTNLVVNFDRPVVLKSGGTVTIRNLGDSSGSSDISIVLPDDQVTVSGPELIINPVSNLAFDTNFAIQISANAIEDTAAIPNAFDGIGDDGTWFFNIAAQDLTAPLILTKSPEDNASEVSPGTNITATFDDEILIGSGDIVIRDLSGGATTQTIAVTDASQVTIAGKVLAVDPAVPLAQNTNYAIQIEAGAVRNLSDLDFGGIPSSDTTTWNFLTRAASPNVVFILGDDQAWYDYSFMRRPGIEQTAINMDSSIHQVAQTPAIDRLADEGLTYTHGYATPICRPSLASIITGAYPHQTLITGNDLAGRPPDQAVEARMQALNPLPRTLANQLGYTCFQTGKWWEGHHNNGGFTAGDTVNSTSGGTAPSQWSGGRPGYVAARHGDWGLMAGRVDYANDVVNPGHPIPYANTVQTATDFIDAQVTAQQPFFLWYAPFLPHTPHDPPTGLITKYDALIDEPNESGDYFAKYYANIERFDGGVGAILDHLDASGITANTIVVLICDNGWINQTNSSSYAARSKQTPYEGGIRTPIIVRWPDHIKAGGAIEPQIITTPVSLVDLVPTIHDALALEVFPEMTGVSLLDLPKVHARRTVFTEDSLHDIQDLNDPSQSLESRVAIRDGWKLIRFTNGSKQLYHLYETATGSPVDPFENNELSASNPALVRQLEIAIANWYNHDFDSWVSDQVFGVDPSTRGFGEDPDGDRLASGIEAWFGTDPGAVSVGLAQIQSDGTTTTFTHPLSASPPDDLTAFYQWSPNLSDWYDGNGIDGPGTGLTVTISAQNEGARATVTATSSAPAEGLYLRVRVIQN